MQSNNTPTRQEAEKALRSVACTLSATVLLTSKHYPDIRKRGQIGTVSGAPGLCIQV